MNRTHKASKTLRNQPTNFDETLAVSMPMPSEAFDRPRLSLSQMRLGLGVIWVAATILAGVGIGRMMNAADVTNFAELPVPIAKADVIPTTVTSGTIATVQGAANPELKVVSATPVTQAQGGNTFATLSLVGYQSAEPSSALQPGFTHFGHSQGNIGTDPVR